LSTKERKYIRRAEQKYIGKRHKRHKKAPARGLLMSLGQASVESAG